MQKPFIIAIDGLSASGKGTLGILLADKLHYKFLPTGNIYRFMAKRLIDLGKDLSNKEEIMKVIRGTILNINDLMDKNLNKEEIARVASKIATMREVREELTNFQRNFALNNYPGNILEGRDIGTVICPDADIKFFVTADLAVRAKRRYEDLCKAGYLGSYEMVVDDLEVRDERDKNRSLSPLVAAPEAIIVDTSNHTITESLKYMLSFIEQTVKHNNI